MTPYVIRLRPIVSDIGEDRGFANGRGEKTEEFVLVRMEDQNGR